MKRVLPLLLGCLLWGAAGAQTTYRWVDPQSGQTVFSDKPPPAGVKLLGRKEQAAANGSDGDGLSFAARRAAENFPVVLYTTADCVDTCQAGRNLLNGRGIPFREKVVATPEDGEELRRAAGGDPVAPTLLVGRQSVRGPELDAWNRLLDLAGYPQTAPYGYKPRSAQEK